MTRTLGAWTAAAAALLFASELQAQDPVPEFGKFDLARERIGHRIVADAVLVNPLPTELRDVKVTAIFFDSERELKRSKPVPIDRIAPGGSGGAKIEVAQVPNFSRYEVVVESGGKRWAYAGDDPDRPPVIKLAGTARLVVAGLTESRPASFPGTSTLVLSLRNAGEGVARAPTAVLTYRAKGGAAVQRVHVRLADTLALDVVDTFEVVVPRVPEYAVLEVMPAWVARELASPPDSQFENDVVAVKQVKVGRLSNGTVLVTGQVRNGLKKTVEKVTVTFALGTREVPLSVAGRIRPGASSPVDFYVPDLGLFDGCSYGLDYSEAADAKGDAEVPSQPTAKRTGSRKASDVDPAVAQRGRMSAEVRGVKWVEGSQFLAMKGGGDVAFLRVALRDRNSKPVHPVGRISATLYDGAKPAGTPSRLIKDESWSTDVDDLGGFKVPAEAVAYDPATGELWVGLLRGDKAKVQLKADVLLTIDGMGVWEWKGLEKTLEAPAKPPDRAK
jgi:hypothetical protein